MKRTLTAAATLVVSSAGAVGFAGTANAAEPSPLPAELPVDNNLAQTAFHAVGTLHSAKGVVGDVIPMGKSEPRSTAREQQQLELAGTLDNLLKDVGKKLGLDPQAPAPPVAPPAGGAQSAPPRTGETQRGIDPVGAVVGAVPNTQNLVPDNPLGEHTAPVPQPPTGRANNPPAPEEVLAGVLKGVVGNGVVGGLGNLGAH